MAFDDARNSFKPNSYKSKDEKKKPAQSVVEHQATVQSQSTVDRLKNVIFDGSIRSLRKTLISDVILPAIKELIFEAGSKGLEMALYGEDGTTAKKGKGPTSYNSIYNGKTTKKSSTKNKMSDFRDITFATRTDAVSVLREMQEWLREYGSVSVMDFYQFSNIDGFDFMDDEYGWFDLSDAEVLRVRGGGFRIELPRPTPLD